MKRSRFSVRAGAPAPGTPLCRLDDIADPGAKGFVLGAGTARFELFVVRRENRIFAYVNECPHALTPLDTWPDTFLTRTNDRIICSTHGARFEIATGLCTDGPCAGKSLEPVAVDIAAGYVRIAAI